MWAFKGVFSFFEKWLNLLNLKSNNFEDTLLMCAFNSLLGVFYDHPCFVPRSIGDFRVKHQVDSWSTVLPIVLKKRYI